MTEVGKVAGKYMERDFLVTAWGARGGSLHDGLVRMANGKQVKP